MDINKDRTNENEAERTDPVFEELEAKVESLVVPCCEFYQTNERTRENHKKCMTQSAAALSYITEYLKTYDRAEARPEFRTFDSVVCFDSLIFCLKHYQPRGKSFMRLFVHVYFKLKKAHNRFLFDRMCRVEADIAHHEIREAIRRRLEAEGISGPRATEMLHSFFSAETYLFAKSRANFFRTRLNFSAEKIAAFEYTLRTNGYVDSLDRIRENIGLADGEFGEYEDSLAPLERKARSGDGDPEDEAEAFVKMAQAEEDADKKAPSVKYDSRELAEKEASWEIVIHATEKAFALAKSEKERAYLRCYLTLILTKELQTGTMPVQSAEDLLSGLAAYIDKPFLQKHWQDDYSEAYQKASEEKARQGKRIQEDAFYKEERMKPMARHLGVELSTIKTYYLKGYKMMIAAGDSLHLVEQDQMPPAAPGTEDN